MKTNHLIRIRQRSFGWDEAKSKRVIPFRVFPQIQDSFTWHHFRRDEEASPRHHNKESTWQVVNVQVPVLINIPMITFILLLT